MKVMVVLLLMIFSAEIVHAQKFNALVKMGDELQKAEKLGEALDNYNEAINLVLEDKETPSSEEWISALYSAGNLATKMTYKRSDAVQLVKKYWNLAKGSRGETMDEKIRFLKGLWCKGPNHISFLCLHSSICHWRMQSDINEISTLDQRR